MPCSFECDFRLSVSRGSSGGKLGQAGYLQSMTLREKPADRGKETGNRPVTSPAQHRRTADSGPPSSKEYVTNGTDPL